MKRYIKYIQTLVIFLFFQVIFSCKEKEISYLVCDCTSNKVEKISLEGGIVALSRDGYKIISIKYGYLTPCIDLPIEFQVEGQLVLFSGSLISTCYKEHSGTGLRSLKVEVSKIIKSDTLYKDGNLIIAIIKTEDYGKAAGFGYRISYKDFGILQTQVPGANSSGPFKTKEDALKIAYVVGYRLETRNEFPSIYLGDLYFLKIIDLG